MTTSKKSRTTASTDAAPTKVQAPTGASNSSKAAPAASTPIVRRPRLGALGRIPVSTVQPVVENGAYPAKAVEGEEFLVSANVYREGHDSVSATVVLTAPDGRELSWRMHQVEPLGLDIFEAWVRPDAVGEWTFRIEAWSDAWRTWLHHCEAKLPALVDVELVCLEGQNLLGRAADNADAAGDPVTAAVLRGSSATLLPQRDPAELLAVATSSSLARAMHTFGPREVVSPTAEYPLRVERKRALFSAWYEFFPRSQGATHDPETGEWTSGTFATSHERLEAAAAMGFDIVYLPPIHPIGTQFRKGRNNSLTPSDQDPGSPWAIGNTTGGHTDIHPDLGTIEDFDALVAKAKSLGLEVAIDFALQASPDHPWVTSHPEFFTTRLDGTIAYAENPPKKYQDIYPINFDNDPEGIYHESLRILEYWISHGVTVFRVDNPHTKAVDFWDWILDQMHDAHPEVIFLAEAFTRPQMMHALGKVGYQLGYTYFTWRNTKAELTEYLTELSTESAPFFRPSFWVNTPDINPFYLQTGNPSAFVIRAVLAATLSPSWGVYSGYELFEHVAVAPGREEYLNSEKYEYRPRDFTAEPNLNMLLGMLNGIRHAHPALQQLRRIHFHHADNDDVLAYSKIDGDDRVLVICSLNQWHGVSSPVHLDLTALGLDAGAIIELTDELSGDTYTWGPNGYVELSPSRPAHVFRVTPK